MLHSEYLSTLNSQSLSLQFNHLPSLSPPISSTLHKMFYHNTRALAQLLLLASMMAGSAMADLTKDKAECTEQLTALATCLLYVEGEAKTPAPDCCSGLKQVLKNNKKCLCLVIQDRNDPDLGGIQINVTLALGLPTICNAPANVSKCPELLNMDPKSPEAQIFYQLNKGSSKSATSPAPSPSVRASSSSSQATSVTQKSDAFCMEKRLIGLDGLALGLLVWILFD